MLLRSIRSRLIGLVIASVVPFTALIGVGLWNQWRTDQTTAVERAIVEARLIAAQVDDHINNLKNLLSGISVAVSFDPQDTDDQRSAAAPGQGGAAALYRQSQSVLARRHEHRHVIRASDESSPAIAATFNRSSRDARMPSAGNSFTRRPCMGRRHRTSGRRRQRQAARGACRRHMAGAVSGRAEHDQASAWQRGPDRRRKSRRHRPQRRRSELDQPRSQSIARGRPALRRRPRHQRSDPLGGRRQTHHRLGARRTGAMDGLGRPAGRCRLCRDDVAAGRGVCCFTLVALLCAFGIAWMLSRKIVRPLRQLGEDASALAAGDLSHRTRVAGQWRSGRAGRRRSIRWPRRSSSARRTPARRRTT